MLRLVDLLSDFCNLVVLNVCRQNATPLLERLVPLHCCNLHAPRLRVYIAQVRMNRWVVALTLDRFAQSCFRFGKLSLPEINPSQAIEICTVIRIITQRIYHHRFCFGQTNSQIPKHIAKVIQRRRVLRIHREYFLEFHFRTIVKLLPLVNCAKQKPCHFVLARCSRQSFCCSRGLFRFLITPPTLVNLRDIQIHFAVCISRRFTSVGRSEEHTSELQSLRHLVCRLLLEKKKKNLTLMAAASGIDHDIRSGAEIHRVMHGYRAPQSPVPILSMCTSQSSVPT